MFEIAVIVDNSVAYGTKFWGEHGLSFLIKSGNGDLTLFDAGATPEVLMRNLALAGEPLGKLKRIVVSHGHYDHAGGLLRLLDECAKEGMKPELYIHPDAFVTKYGKTDEGYKNIGLGFDRNSISEKCKLIEVKTRKVIGEGLELTGEIPQVSDFESIEGNFYVREKDEYKPDGFHDEISLVMETEGKRYALVGCGHPGIVNILRFVDNKMGKLAGFLGGTHLVSAKHSRLQDTADEMIEIKLERAYFSHCTGMRASSFLASQLEGVWCSPTSAGMIIKL